MPHLVSEALDYNDFLWQFRSFPLNFPTPVVATSGDPTSLPEVIDDVGAAPSVGDGRVYMAALSARAVLEEITLTCTTGGGDGVAIFSVSGGTTGAFTTANITAGVRYVSNDVYIYIRTTVNWSAVADADRIRFTFEQGRSTALVQETELCTFTAATDLIERDDNENWTDHGYQQGGGIFVADAVDAANDGFHLIASIATDALTIDDTLSTIADETADSVTIQPYDPRPANVGLVVDFTNTGDEVFLQGVTDGWNSLNITEGDYIRIENAATGGHNDFWKVIRVFTSGGGTNRDTLQLEAGAITADDADDTVTITGYHIPERWCEDRFREGADEVSMTAPPTEDGDGNFNTTWEFHGPGISGTEANHGSVSSLFSNSLGHYNISMRMADSFLRSNSHGTHPNSSDQFVYVLLNNAPMQFYASYNGDAMWGFVRGTGADEPFYLGVMARHGTTLQLPFPAFVGGCAGIDDDGSTQLLNNNTTAKHSAFYRANMDTGGGGLPVFETSRAWFQRKDGAWGNIVHGLGTTNLAGRDNGASVSGAPMLDGWITPFHLDNLANEDTATQIFLGMLGMAQRIMRSGFGDVFERVPMEVHDVSNVYGELHGLFAITPDGDTDAAVEDHTIDAGIRYVFAKNTFRSADNEFIAIRLEP